VPPQSSLSVVVRAWQVPPSHTIVVWVRWRWLVIWQTFA
jgi:hypothetical protein